MSKPADCNQDGTPYQSAGAKAAPQPTGYEQATAGDKPFPHDEEAMDDHGDDDLLEDGAAAVAGNGLNGHPTNRAPAADPDDELLNDDGETGPGEVLPQVHAAGVDDPDEESEDDPAAHETHRTITDPAVEDPFEELEAFEK